MDAVAGDRTDVVVEIENNGVFGGDGDVAHQADFGVEAGAVEDADGGDFQVVDQRADVDAAVLVGVFVGPVLQVFFLEFEAFGIGVHHEVVAGAGEDHDFVFRVGADGFEELADGAVIFDAELDGAAPCVGLREDDAVGAAVQFVVLLEAFLVFLEFGGGDEIDQGHV